MGAEHAEPTLERLREKFAAGDVDAARRALLQLSDRGVAELEKRLGTTTVQRMMRASRGLRGALRGRVVVLHGIMGGKLATIDDGGDEDLVWLNYLRLINGRIERLALDENAQPLGGRYRVETRGLLDEYMPLVFELSQAWKVLPVAYDWRLNIDVSAARLDAQIRQWADGEPVHIVAHSMGGLVSRRFMQRFPQAWAAMQDPLDMKRGGRLVMLGTPNRGSFAIPFVLTGTERLVRRLEAFDLRHDMPELLNIINTFPGSYQMLPSPLVDVGDDRQRLFDTAVWGPFPVARKYLQLGRDFQSEMDAVQDPHRLVYVAGFNRNTPYRVRVNGPGDFSYQETLDGDGRVPHELGLLAGVPTFWVDEVHGNLASNEHVMAALHDLLANGETKQLESRRPAARATRPLPRWRRVEEIVAEPIPAATPLRSVAQATAEDAAAAESAIVSIFAGTGESEAVRSPTTQPPVAAARRSPARKTTSTPPITLEVMWADITQVDGDVVAAGHYEGLEPHAGELGLDKAISGVGPGEAYAPDDLVITSHTRRGILRGAVGDINFFPWWDARKTVAIAGMGHPGTFGVQSLRRTTRSLAESVATLRGVKVVNTLLIGSGFGNLDAVTAVAAMLQGLRDAMDTGLPKSQVRRIRLVEWELRKAQRMAQALSKLGEQVPDLRVIEGVQTGPGGVVGEEIAISAIVLSTAWRIKGDAAAARKAAREVLQGMDATPELRRSCDAVLRRLGEQPRGDLLAQSGALDLAVRASAGSSAGRPSTRVSFLRDAGGIRAAAISETAVVSERMMPVDWALVDEIIGRMTDPEDAQMMRDLGGLMTRLFVPADFRDRLGTADRVIVEVDRETSRIQWEMMESFRQGASQEPLGLDSPLARQLRTSYSPTPSVEVRTGAILRALVIGDPGDPAQGLDLEGARHEALSVDRLLRSRGVQVDLLIGAPNVPRTGELRGKEPATILNVLRLLDKNTYDILHYAGHGDFDADDPERRAGWIFGDRYFTSRELARVSRVPSLVVANACLSGRTSNVRAGTGAAPKSRLTDADEGLLPGLVDEFFKRGVRNYIGTAWPISDAGAVQFSTVLYESLLPEQGGAPADRLGDALLKARRALKAQDHRHGALWAAYQHYGDPAILLRPAG